MDAGTIFIFDIRSLGVNVRAEWNEIRIYANPSGARRIVQAKLNPYLVEGENLASAVFRPAEMVPEPGKAPAKPYLHLRVQRGQMGQAAATTLAEFHWREGEGPLPAAWRSTIRIGEAFGRWLWEAAPRVPPGAADRQAILGVLNRLRDALTAADLATVSEMFAVKNQEMARALDLPAAEVTSAMQDAFVPFFAAPQRNMEPLSGADMQWAVQAQGRLITVNSLDGLPAIRGHAGDVRVQVPVTLTRSGKQWVIAR